MDLQKGYLEVRATNSKNHRSRLIPLSATAKTVLESWHEDQDPAALVVTRIGNHRKNLYDGLGKSFELSCKEAGIEGVSFHSLRRTFTVRLLERGTNPAVVQALLGHSSIALTMEVYGRARRDDIESAVKALE